METAKSKYEVRGGPKGLPFIGLLRAANRDPLWLLADNGLRYGDIIPFTIMGRNIVQVNHPDLVRQVLMENHKNYKKSKAYIRFESVLGQGLLTSNGEKWKRDRQKIQPMFRREQIEGYYFGVVSDVADKYKRRWFALTEQGEAEIDVTQEMAAITLEVIVKLIFGKDNLDEATIHALHRASDVFLAYLKKIRTLPKVDFDKVFHTPRYRRFKREIVFLDGIITHLLDQYKAGVMEDKLNMLALLFDAQQKDPANFTEQDVRDQCKTMIFAGFETTSIIMQWMWFALDERPDIERKLRESIIAATPADGPLTFAQVDGMDYLAAVFKETMRLYPSFWVTSREPIEDDYFGDFLVRKGSNVVIPQIVMHRHPRFWEKPNEFLPERFLNGNDAAIDDGLYFPFSAGARKCSGYRLAEMEAMTVFAKLLPHFTLTVQNKLGNGFDPSLSIKPKHSLKVRIRRL